MKRKSFLDGFDALKASRSDQSKKGREGRVGGRGEGLCGNVHPVTYSAVSWCLSHQGANSG